MYKKLYITSRCFGALSNTLPQKVRASVEEGALTVQRISLTLLFWIWRKRMGAFSKYISKMMGRGAKLIPYPSGSKHPTTPGWQQISYGTNDFAPDSNLGLQVSSTFADVDLDCPEALRLADFFLPRTEMEHGRRGAPRAHRWFSLDGDSKYKKFADAGGDGVDPSTLLELRVSSKKNALQTMIPPSVHPNGEKLEWSLVDADGTPPDPPRVPYTTLRQACGRLAAACLLVRHFPGHRRNELALALSGMLLKRAGWSTEEAEKFILVVFQEGGSDAPEARARAVAATRAKLDINEPVTGIPTLVEILGDKVVHLLVDWLEVVREDVEALPSTEIEFAMYVAAHNPDMIWRTAENTWFKWTGKVWEPAPHEEMVRRVFATQKLLDTEVRKTYQNVDGKRGADDSAGMKRAKAAFALSQQLTRVRAADTMARAVRSVMQRDDVTWNRDPDLFNVDNGTIDLRTFQKRAHLKEDFITKVSPVAFDPQARPTEWMAFLEQMLPSPEARTYVQTLMGYCLTGHMSEQVFTIFWGSGLNGKSTCVEVLAHVLGTYAITASSHAFLERHSDTNSGIVALEGARFVRCSEPARGQLDEAIVKQMTGDDEFAARGVYEKMRVIRPTWKVVMLCNDVPQVSGADNGIWRRLRLVPWDVKIDKDHVVKNFPKLLKEEAAGILNWCLAGCHTWREEGLAAPDIITQATDEYRTESDPLDGFIEEFIDLGEGLRDRTGHVYLAYVVWTKTYSIRPMSRREFTSRMKHRGFQKRKYEGYFMWRGLTRNALARKAMAFLMFSPDDSDE